MSGPKLLAAVVLLAASAVASWRLHRPAEAAGAARLAQVPVRIGSWSGRDLEVTARHRAQLETDDVLLRRYRDGALEALACVAVAGPAQKAAHPPEVCYRGQGWRIEAAESATVALSGRPVPLQELVIAREDERHLVWSWYRVGGDETGSWWREQWLSLRARLAGRDVPAALLRFSTPIAGPDAASVGEGRATLGRFAAAFLPVVDAALAAPAQGGEAAGGKARAR